MIFQRNEPNRYVSNLIHDINNNSYWSGQFFRQPDFTITDPDHPKSVGINESARNPIGERWSQESWDENPPTFPNIKPEEYDLEHPRTRRRRFLTHVQR